MDYEVGILFQRYPIHVDLSSRLTRYRRKSCESHLGAVEQVVRSPIDRADMSGVLFETWTHSLHPGSQDKISIFKRVGRVCSAREPVYLAISK